MTQMLNNDILETGIRLIQIGGAIAQIKDKLIPVILLCQQDQLHLVYQWDFVWI